MKKNFITFLFLISFTLCSVTAQEQTNQLPKRETIQHQKEVMEYLDSRLHFTDEQKNTIKRNNQKYRKEMEKTIKSMQKLHSEIKEVYMLGIPKYQADIRTATKKAQLVIYKQNAIRIRDERRRAFDSILDEKQKIEFEKIKKEIAKEKEKQQ